MGSEFYCGIIFWELFQFNAKCLVYLGFLCFLQSINVYHDDIFLENCPFHLCFQVHTKMCKPCILFSLCLFPFSFPPSVANLYVIFLDYVSLEFICGVCFSQSHLLPCILCFYLYYIILSALIGNNFFF